MNATGHVVVGCGTTAVGLQMARSAGLIDLPVTYFVTAVVVAGVAALLPDVDHPNSIMSKLAAPLLLAGLFIWLASPRLPDQIGGALWLNTLVALSVDLSPQAILGLSMVITAMAMIFVPVVTSHRGVTHSVLLTITVTAASLVYYSWAGMPVIFGLCFGWGWLSHLLLDATTKMGLPDWAWPLQFDDYDL